MFLNACDHASCVVCKCIHIKLSCLLEKLVDQDRSIWREADRITYVGFERLRIINNCHCPTTQHVAWSNQNGIPDPRGHFSSFFNRCGHAISWLGDAYLLEEHTKSFTIFSQVD